MALHDILDPEAKNVQLSDLPMQQQVNLIGYELQVIRDVIEGDAGDIAVVDLGRSEHAVFGMRIQYDIVPSLTCKQTSLFVISTEDADLADVNDRRFRRFLTMRERYELLGYPGLFCELLPKTAAQQLIGNAYALPMVAAAVAPLMCIVGLSGLGPSSQPPEGGAPVVEAEPLPPQRKMRRRMRRKALPSSA